MKILIIGLTGLLFTNTVFSQQTLRERGEMGLYLNTTGNNEAINVKDIKGSPYFVDKYFYAFVDGDTSKPHLMRYNAYLDQMEFEKDGIQHTLENSYRVINFDTPINKKYVLTNYSINEINTSGYLIELNSGKEASIFKREKIVFFPESLKPNGLSETHTPAEFKPAKSSYFIKIREGDILESPKSKDKFSKLFGDNEKSISEYIKKNKISLTDENDLIKLFKHLNSN